MSKQILCGLFSLCSAAVFAASLGQNGVVARAATPVDVLSVKSATIVNQVLTPETSTAVAKASAILELKVEVEGNICGAEANSLEVLRTRIPDSWDTRVALNVSRPYDLYHPPAIPTACAAFSAPTVITVPVGLSDYFFKDQPEMNYKILVSARVPQSVNFQDVVVTVHATAAGGYQIQVQQ